MKKRKIDICMTATVRPTIIQQTLQSFTTKIFTEKSRYRLIINIDPIGEGTPRKKIVKIAKMYFDDVVVNLPEKPSFTKAVQWCWGQTINPFVFHLEDDWSILIPINIDNMINILDKYQEMVSLRLNKEKSAKQKNKGAIINGFVYYPKISLNPTLFKGEFVRQVSPLMDLTRNPEKQLRANKSKLGQLIGKFNHAIYTKDSVRATVRDEGRAWMTTSKYKKKTGFLNWEQK